MLAPANMSQTLLLRGQYHRCAAMVAMRSFSGAVSASSSAVDQMIDYAMGQRKTNPDMAVDVLMSGLSYTSPQADPIGNAQLHLSIAQLEADRNRWANAHAQASSGLRVSAQSVAGSAAAAELAYASGSLATRALLVMGHDSEARSLASECEAALRATAPPAAAGPQAASSSTGGSAAHIRSLGLLALAARTVAAASADGEVDALASALGSDPAAATRAERSLADAAQSLGLLRALQGRTQEAEVALAAAAEAAAAERAEPAASTSGWAREQHNCEVEADALTGRAQLLMRSREWGEAEELLGAALKAAEAAHGERSPSLAPLLTLLGYTYSRSARVTFAEGLFREAAKLLRLDPSRVHQQQSQQEQQPAEQQQQSASPLLRTAADSGVHASAVAVLAWRYAQLLWVLPNRGGEAARWEGCARQFWAASGGLAGREIEAMLGGEGHLKGEGPEGSGVMFSTRFRRAWPCSPNP
ncbi:hypothetical protein PLESTB_000358800 [Pleodorina starrii]|uniref:Uncharacterized protein n=1 Tax=Pleodorina starrii TaxID=330485 RepID=A0A9W6EZ53_9CHLO|nr:hypothetical protein PLESTM_000036600 [Pleodorina starrii]GLC50249.1 hypothetical protein PLESTB_000358800 [Pleodorina starrii]GLC64369.1 hypothetical protein PLESTF_000153900 [Pleodorina starrii]